MLKEIVPRLERVALVANLQTSPYEYFLRAAEAAATSLAIKIVPTPVAKEGDIEHASSSHSRSRRVEHYFCRQTAQLFCIAIS